MNPKALQIISVVLRLLLGGLFVYASLYKIQSPGMFAQQIFNYKVLPVWAINPLALVLPWLQLFTGAALLAGVWVRAAGWWIVIMLAVFQAALGSALLRGLDVSCGCFEAGGRAATWLTFGRDTLMLVAALLYQRLLWMTSAKR